MAKAVSPSHSPARLALENGSVFYGSAVGAQGTVSAELVFHTTVSGYEEVLLDPAGAGQLLVFTSPEIGNSGITDDSPLSPGAAPAGVVFRKLSPKGSNWRLKLELDEWLKRNQVVGLAEIDTRALVRQLRQLAGTGSEGTLAVISSASVDEISDAALVELARQAKRPLALNNSVLGSDGGREWTQGAAELFQVEAGVNGEAALKSEAAQEGLKEAIPLAVVDLGLSRSFLRQLVDAGFAPTVFSPSASAEQILGSTAKGVLLSNGPGNPATLRLDSLAGILGKLPVFGVELGAQVLAVALGAKTRSLPLGHHGDNLPVQEIDSKAALITLQNHSFAIDESSLPSALKASHRSLFDDSLMGFEAPERRAAGLCFQLESAPFSGENSHPLSALRRLLS